MRAFEAKVEERSIVEICGGFEAKDEKGVANSEVA